jgi:hypothetical protein
MQIGAPIRIVAFVGLLAALAMGAWTFTAGRTSTGGSGSSKDSQVASVAQNPIAAAQSVASKLSAHNRATAAGKPDVAPSAAPASAPPPARSAAPRPAATTAGATTTIASALSRHRVAVVLLYDPEARVDWLSLGEAQLGAERAHAAFLRVDVMKQRQAEPFAKAFGVVQVPTLLFFARPGRLVQKVVGFADQDTVAQAAFNAAHGLVVAQG